MTHLIGILYDLKTHLNNLVNGHIKNLRDFLNQNLFPKNN